MEVCASDNNRAAPRKEKQKPSNAYLAAFTFWRLLMAAWRDELSVADQGWRKFLLISSSWIVLQFCVSGGREQS